MKHKQATSQQIKEWHESDFLMRGKFDVLAMFVVVPTIIQIVVFFTMLAAFKIISYFI